MNRNKIKQGLEKLKLRYDKKYNSTEIFLKPGDSIRIKKNNGEYSQPKTVIRCGKTSVSTSDGKKWPLDKVSIRQRHLQSPSRKIKKSFREDVPKEARTAVSRVRNRSLQTLAKIIRKL